jgi:hypothetical protein
MTCWLSDSWGQIQTEMIVESFSHCFLGDVFQLYIARHEQYGTLFRLQLAIMLENADSGSDADTLGESDPYEIDDK